MLPAAGCRLPTALLEHNFAAKNCLLLAQLALFI
jgi:hypothetical protein